MNPVAESPRQQPFTAKIIDGPQHWIGREIADDLRWQHQLDHSDVVEIEKALAALNGGATDRTKITPERFPLGRLGAKLRAIGQELEDGCGFCRIRGLPLTRWSKEDVESIWIGIAQHLGTLVYQDAQGQLLREIKAESGDVGQRYGRLATDSGNFLSSRARTASNAELRYHTDRCDIVGLLCTGQARLGGISKLCSSVAVHNVMLQREPALCASLYHDLPRSRIGEESGGEKAWYLLPVWGVRDGKFTSHYSRTYVEALKHVDQAPTVTAVQWQAMDQLASIAEEISLSMQLQPGDMQFLNNHVIYHARTRFEDDPSKGFERCLLRVWLSAPHRALPASHKVLWREVESGKLRGGISQQPVA